jgi:hypothetical protein
MSDDCYRLHEDGNPNCATGVEEGGSRSSSSVCVLTNSACTSRIFCEDIFGETRAKVYSSCAGSIDAVRWRRRLGWWDAGCVSIMIEPHDSKTDAGFVHAVGMVFGNANTKVDMKILNNGR